MFNKLMKESTLAENEKITSSVLKNEEGARTHSNNNLGMLLFQNLLIDSNNE